MGTRRILIHERTLNYHETTIEKLKWREFGFPEDTSVVDIRQEEQFRAYIVQLKSREWELDYHVPCEFPPTLGELRWWTAKPQGEILDPILSHPETIWETDWQPIFVHPCQPSPN